VLNGGDPLLRQCAHEAKSKVRFFVPQQGLNANQAAVVEVAAALGIAQHACTEVFAAFTGLPHRMELAGEVRGVRFINDSKSTLVESTVWGLNALPAGVVLIAGGKDKGIDYTLVREAAREKVRKAILIGEARPLIRKALEGYCPVEEAASLEEAVRKALAAAQPGDSVLLSPMCASFDMFRDYEHRGEVFKHAVAALRQESSP
jgi:UDP-N-acetylmuramoylalanine--D-glutamate ligase